MPSAFQQTAGASNQRGAERTINSTCRQKNSPWVIGKLCAMSFTPIVSKNLRRPVPWGPGKPDSWGEID